jgi:hypothetical protein
LLVARWLLGMGAAASRALPSDIYARMKEFVRCSTSIPFRWLLSDVCHEFMQRLSMVLCDTLGSYLRDTLHEGRVITCLRVPRPLCVHSPNNWKPSDVGDPHVELMYSPL